MIDFNSFLLIIAGLALIGGIVFGIYSNKIFSLSYKVKKKNDRSKSQNFKVKEEDKANEKNENEKQKKIQPNLFKSNFQVLEDEVKIYRFEKELVSHAIENILNASKNRSIDIFEKDRLLLKYNDQLKKLNEKMDKIQSEIDVTKLIDLRNDLASLLDNKISDIDEKIKEINVKIQTKSKILETKNQNKKNSSSINNNLNNINSSSDIEETINANLKAKKAINYKNNIINKNKETNIEAERRKIIDLKDQVLTALNRLDRTGIIKEEIKNNEISMMQDNNNKIKQDLSEEDNNKKSLNKINDSNNKDHKNQIVVAENKISPKISINEKKGSVPKIFSSIMRVQSKSDIQTPTTTTTTKVITNPLLKNINRQGMIIKNDDDDNDDNDESIKKIKVGNPFINENQFENNYNDNKNCTPLSNLLKNSDLKFNHFIYTKDFEKGTNKTQNEDKTSLSNDRSITTFKFPLRFIFSKINKEKKSENRISETNTKRKDSLSNILN